VHPTGETQKAGETGPREHIIGVIVIVLVILFLVGVIRL
jgi:hypothetical protein